jgi:hypothetical protein
MGGKTLDTTKKYTLEDAKSMDIKQEDLKGFLKID